MCYLLGNYYICKKNVIFMSDNKVQNEELLQNEPIQPKGQRKKFQGFSLGFLLLLLGLVVAVYVACTVLAA